MASAARAVPYGTLEGTASLWCNFKDHQSLKTNGRNC